MAKQKQQKPLFEAISSKNMDDIRKNINNIEHRHIVLDLVYLKCISDDFLRFYKSFLFKLNNKIKFKPYSLLKPNIFIRILFIEY